jgi:hypothetical protein
MSVIRNAKRNSKALTNRLVDERLRVPFCIDIRDTHQIQLLFVKQHLGPSPVMIFDAVAGRSEKYMDGRQEIWSFVTYLCSTFCYLDLYIVRRYQFYV